MTGGLALWDHLHAVGKRSNILGFPRAASLAGIAPSEQPLTHLERAVASNQSLWDQVCQEIAEGDWDYLQSIDHTAEVINEISKFSKQQDRPSAGAMVSGYYQWLDLQLGRVMELLDDCTALMLVSPGGVQPPMRSVLAVNDWLIEQNLLTLQNATESVTSLNPSRMNWGKTRAWAEIDDDCAQIFLNLKGREPEGIVVHSEYDGLREEICSRLRSVIPNEAQVKIYAHKPEEIFRETLNIVPDLIAYAGFVPAASGTFVFSSPGNDLRGERKAATFLDIAPTMLHAAGYQVPDSMQGRTMLAEVSDNHPGDADSILHDRLAGLGYV